GQRSPPKGPVLVLPASLPRPPLEPGNRRPVSLDRCQIAEKIRPPLRRQHREHRREAGRSPPGEPRHQTLDQRTRPHLPAVATGSLRDGPEAASSPILRSGQLLASVQGPDLRPPVHFRTVLEAVRAASPRTGRARLGKGTDGRDAR